MKDKEIEIMFTKDKMNKAKIFLENLEMNMSYEHQDTIHLLMDLVDINTPKKVGEIYYVDGYVDDWPYQHYNGTCPECGCFEVLEGEEYCPKCHQRLDWSILDSDQCSDEEPLIKVSL